MYKFGRFLTVSVLAICTASAANATVVTQTRLNTALGDKVNVDQTATNKDKAVITNSSGQITTGTIATGMITDGAVTKGKLDSSVQESLGKADTAIQSHQDISGKQDVDNMVTAITGPDYNSALGSTDLYPSMKTAGKMISNAMGTTTTDITNLQNTYVKHSSNTAAGSATVPVYVAEDGTATPITSYAGNAATATNVAWSGVTNKPTINGESMETNVVLDAADVGAVPVAQGNDAIHQNKVMITDGTGNVTVGTIATGMITNGAVTEGKIASNAVTSAKIANGTIVNEDIADSTIAKGKLDSSVQASLGKADTAIQSHQDISGKQDVDNMVTAITGPDYNSALGSTDLYPSMKTAGQMITNSLSQTVTDVANLKTGKQNKLSSENGGNVTVSGNTGFVQTVTAADGVVTVTRSAIAENDVTNLTTDLANAQNKIPSGSENSATLASIWVE